jgi:hypothetical protein
MEMELGRRSEIEVEGVELNGMSRYGLNGVILGGK